MKEFLLEGLLYPFVAILFCLAFGVPFTYAGFQTIHLQGSKEGGIVNMDLTRKHFWGIYVVEEHVAGVLGADLDVSRFRQSGRRRGATGVFLVTETEAVRVLEGSSDVDEALKWEMVDSINDFVKDPGVTRYNKIFRIQNVFGWVGLPFLILGLLGLVGWPGAIIKRLKD